MKLKAEQRRLYAFLGAQARCFVRVCDDDAALWVSDFPRKSDHTLEMLEQLQMAGFSIRTDDQARLCYIDWTEERWREVMETLPRETPVFPADDKWHETYALCRLLLAHPAPLTADHLPYVRRVMKLAAETPEKLFKASRMLREEAAAQLREGKTIANAAGWVLAAWLNEQSDRKETQQ